jgi:arylsulfatase A-like enzyme
LLIYYPMMGRRGTEVNEITNHTDIMPTILDLLHIRNKNRMDGQSLKYYVSWSPIDLLFSHKLDRNRTFSATYSPEARVNSFSMYDGQMKLIHTPDKSSWQWEAYDMDEDPLERTNIARFDEKKFNSQNIVVRRGILEEFRKEAETAHRNQKNGTVSPEEQDMLNALGYTNGHKKRPPQTQGMQDSDYEAEDTPHKP